MKKSHTIILFTLLGMLILRALTQPRLELAQPVPTVRQTMAVKVTEPASDAAPPYEEDSGPATSGEVDASTADRQNDAIQGVKNRIVFLTVQTSTSNMWCRLLASAQLSGVELHTLGWNHDYKHVKRPRWILDWIKEQKDKGKLRSSDILMFSDGSDTVYTGVAPDVISAKYAAGSAPSLEEWKARGEDSWEMPPVMFNAEANCYHQQAFQGSWGVLKGRCIAAYKRKDPNATTRYRYLNAGAWIGRVWGAEIVFAAAKARIDADRSLWCDQSVLGAMYLSDVTHGVMGLDRRNAIFLPTYHLRVGRDLCDSGSSMPDDREPSKIRMCHSGEEPALLHFNGRSEGTFTAALLKITKWAHKKGNAGAMTNVKDSTVRLYSSGGPLQRKVGDLCPKINFPA